MYQLKRQYPKLNFHYRRNCKVVGAIDLNEKRFDSEYKERFQSKWEEYKNRNQPSYLQA